MSPSIGQEFMRLTRTAIQPEPPQALGVSQPPLELPYDETQPLIALPDPHTVQPVDASLLGLIEQRSSVRRYATQPLSLAELSYLLWCTQGVKPLKLPDRTLRTVPSAGARHPFETLLLINRVEGLEPGLYRYLASQHSLIALRLDEPTLSGSALATTSRTSRWRRWCFCGLPWPSGPPGAMASAAIATCTWTLGTSARICTSRRGASPAARAQLARSTTTH